MRSRRRCGSCPAGADRFGPPIEDGFYYDFDIGRPFGPEDLEEIEKQMVQVVKGRLPFVREEVSRNEAKKRSKTIRSSWNASMT